MCPVMYLSRCPSLARRSRRSFAITQSLVPAFLGGLMSLEFRISLMMSSFLVLNCVYSSYLGGLWFVNSYGLLEFARLKSTLYSMEVDVGAEAWDLHGYFGEFGHKIWESTSENKVRSTVQEHHAPEFCDMNFWISDPIISFQSGRQSKIRWHPEGHDLIRKRGGLFFGFTRVAGDGVRDVSRCSRCSHDLLGMVMIVAALTISVIFRVGDAIRTRIVAIVTTSSSASSISAFSSIVVSMSSSIAVLVVTELSEFSLECGDQGEEFFDIGGHQKEVLLKSKYSARASKRADSGA
ncbi:hypothetical protein PIB30_035302 [Stylosanthes scabra]|uniref:Uncharacterized protein n=1 Tax=Stylosanthes scabra TaxID=79078 RepID=A0ABU6ZAS4_9FABA|nr:hypothetical protein [Stylosanthes scabra]